MEKALKEVEDLRAPKEPLEPREQLEHKGKEDHKATLEPRELRVHKEHKVTEDLKERKER